MSVTCETFQFERLPSKVMAPENMLFMSVTPERSGASVAAYPIDEAPLKADSIKTHRLEPHWSIDASLEASSWPSRCIPGKVPYILTWWSPASAYVWVASPVMPVLLVPSPQMTV